MDKSLSWLDKIDDVMSFIASIALFIMMAWVSLDVFFRFAFNSPIPGTTDIASEYIMVILVYLAISSVQKSKEHINITFVTEKLNKFITTYFTVICNLIACIIFFLMSYFNHLESLRNLYRDIRSISYLNYPIAPAIWIISIGTFLLAIRLLVESIVLIWKYHYPSSNKSQLVISKETERRENV